MKIVKILTTFLFCTILGSLFSGFVGVSPYIGVPVTMTLSAVISVPAGSLLSTTAGYIDETTLMAIRVLAEKLKADNRIGLQFKPRGIEFINAFRSLMSLPVQEFKLNNKINTVVLKWMNVCADLSAEFSNCGNSCNKASTNIETRTLTKEFVKCYDVSEDDWRRNDFDMDEALAKETLVADKQIVDDLCQYLMTCMSLWAGVNTQGTAGKGVVSGHVTYIEPAFWDPSIMAYLARVAAFNQFTDPTLFDGATLQEIMYLARLRAANADGKGDSNLMGIMPYFSDEYNMSLVSPANSLFMVQRGSVAFANQAFYENYREGNPKREGQYVRYSRPNLFMPDLMQDIYIKSTCNEGAGAKGFTYNTQVVLTAQAYLNPAGCDQDNTGILEFQCGTPTP